jgi:hypothetical protein
MTNRQPPTAILTRDVERDRHALGFWGVTSGALTVQEAFESLAAPEHVSAQAQRLRPVLTDLGNRGVLDPRTTDPGFDADRRCRWCGTTHEGLPGALAGTCPRGRWGTVRENPAGLRGRR